MTRQLPALLICLSLIACQSSSSFSTDDKKTVTNDVRQTLYKYYDDINQSGLLAELPYLDSSADFFWVPPAYADPISYSDVATYIRQAAPVFRNVVNKWDTLRITPLTKELASYTGKLSSTITDSSGITETHLLIETGLMIKRKDGWKLLNGQTSSLSE